MSQPVRNPSLDLQGLAIPRLGFGTWRLSGTACREAVELALATGYRHLDTATMYNNEDDVGAAIASSGVPRSELFVGTKVWRDDLRRDALLRSAEASARRLGSPPDVLMIHWPNADVPLQETMSALDEVRRAGLTRHVGVSNFPVALLEEAAGRSESPILVNQCEYHPGLDQGAIIAACRAAGTAFVAYRPLGQGRMLDEPLFTRIAEAHGKTPGQVVLRWHLQQDGVVAIPRSASPAHIADNFSIFDFELSQAEMTAIFALAERSDRHVNPDWAPAWDSGTSGGA